MGEVRYGVTDPISSAWPTKEEEQVTELLLETLRKEGQFESEEESRNREVVLGKIDKLMKEFVYKALLKHKVSESLARTCGGKIFTYGSYRLGVHGAGADIDTLCVAPSPVTREDFFEIMVDLLKGRSETSEVVPVPSAYVPVITMQFDGIDIDLTFATLIQPTVPEDQDLFDVNLLRNLDESAIRAINGSRVTDEILRLVPNIPTFRLALRCIKLWAKRRAVYSNSIGFFGGVAWAMLVARICQLYPNACAALVVARFFRVFLRWKWPEPVLLKPIETGNLRFQVWNPKLYPQHAMHRMPIITPAYPSMCATHNVTQSTQRIMMSEFKRGLEITERIMKNEAEWDELFAKNDFFRRYKYYLQSMESRVRMYVGLLEGVDLIVIAHPYIKGHEHDHTCSSEEEVRRARDGDMLKDVKPSTKATHSPGAASDTQEKPDATQDKHVYVASFYIGLLLKEKTQDSNGKRRMDLSNATQEFIRKVKASSGWDEEAHMNISIRFLRQSQLPDELFGGLPRSRLRVLSETKKKSKPEEGLSKKREKDVNADSSAKTSKKAKVVDAPVPSTSGVAVKVADEKEGSGGQENGNSMGSPNNKQSDGNGAGESSENANSSKDKNPIASATIAAPVPAAAKAGGIKLKLLGSS
ncbi:Poly(A) polymerase central domain-containing protein [Coemansia spiralis]|nr:Poly(A) polymerase central domain-containing protein [Coemansia spiralis]